MDAETKQELDRLEQGIDAFIAETDQRLHSIAQSMSRLSEMVEVYGGFTSATFEAPAQHRRDDH